MLLRGKEVAEKNRLFCLEQVEVNNLNPHLYVFLIGDEPGSKYYVESIIKQSTRFKINITIDNYKDNEITENLLIEKIKNLNENKSIHGIMVQKPLPKNINTSKIELAISPEKDIDGFHAMNAGLMLYEKECFLPCTAEAILEIMDFYGISAEGKHVVVVGRSNVVGKPIANLLLYKQKGRNATVTICHSKTPDLSIFTRQADILITAVGVPKIIKSDMIKDRVIILDAGINEVVNSEKKIEYVGDIDFEACNQKAEAITPVPGGVGSVTTSILFKHVCLAAKKI